MGIKVLLHNIRSMHNVGSVFRTSDAAGVEHIYLTGYTPVPPRKEIEKTAIGATEYVSWSYDDEPWHIIAAAKQSNAKIVLLEQTNTSIDLYESQKEIEKDQDIIFMVGSEVKGADQELIDAADLCIEIPMLGQKESLNVSVAFAITLFELVHQPHTK